MKALDRVKTDDLNEEQKKILADFIKTEMIKKIEESVTTNSSVFADQVKKYLQQDKDKENLNELNNQQQKE